MQLARRLYLYFICAVALIALAIGLANLLELLIESVRDASGGREMLAGDRDAVRRELSIYAAIVVVALPIWLLHWWMAERGLRIENGDEERRSAIRALYLTAALTGSLVAISVTAIQLIEAAIVRLVGSDHIGLAPDDIEQWLAILTVSGAIWAYHAVVRIGDTRATIQSGAADWLSRMYSYAAAFGGLAVLALATGDLLALVVEVATSDDGTIVDGRVWDGLLASAIARALVGGAIWAAFWTYLTRLTTLEDWRGTHARASALRRFYLYIGAFGAVIATLILATRAGEALLGTLFDGLPGDAEPLSRRLLDPLVRLVPFVVVWLYHRRHVLAEATAWSEGARQATVRRVYVYAIALIGLALTGYGLSSLLTVSIGRASVEGGVVGSGGGDPWRSEVAQLTALTLVGLTTWLWHWYQTLGWLRTDPGAERNATVRRVYLFTSIAGSIVGLLVSLAVIIYRVFAEALGVEATEGPFEELSRPLAVFTVAAGILLYHALLLRADLAERSGADDAGSTIRLVISGPAGADADSLAATLQPHLPEGYSIQSVSTAR